MIEKIKVTASFMAVGVVVSLGYAAVAQQSQFPVQPPNAAPPTTSPAPVAPQTVPPAVPQTTPPAIPQAPGVQAPPSVQPTTSPGPLIPQVPPPATNPTTAPATQQTTPPATQQRNRPATGQTQSRLSTQDRQFMSQAAQGGMAEVIMGQLAVQRAASNDVKKYAQLMVNEHTRVNSELMQLATRKGVTLPKDINTQQKALRARLGQLPSNRFDQTYIREAGVRSHAQQVVIFQRQVQRGQDSDVKAFAAKTLPAVQNHLNMARAMVKTTAAPTQNRTRS